MPRLVDTIRIELPPPCTTLYAMSRRPHVPSSVLYLDLDFYAARYPDLKGFSDARLLAHFLNFGVKEGRAGCAEAFRSGFVKLIPKTGLVLEIGPFNKPILSGPNVRYFDVLDRDALKARAAKVGRDPETAVSPLTSTSRAEADT